MKENAILIRQLDVLKIYVDLSDMENIYKVLDADRIATIHTIKTQEISSKLGIHLIGFVNRNFDDSINTLACEFSGYDYLGSSMLVCKTDDKYNALPLNESELECVYTYLTEGKIIPLSIKKDAAEFFKENGINPVLPEFGLEPETILLGQYPDVIVLKYDFSELTDKEIAKVGMQLFGYSGRLINELKYIDEENLIHLNDDGTYYLKNYFPEDRNSYYVIIQVVQEPGESPILLDIISMIKEGRLLDGPAPEILEEPEEEDDGPRIEPEPEEEINGHVALLGAYLEEFGLEDMLLPYNISGLTLYPEGKVYLLLLRYEYSEEESSLVDEYFEAVDIELNDLGSGKYGDPNGRYMLYLLRNKDTNVLIIHIQVLNIADSNSYIFIDQEATKAVLEMHEIDPVTLLKPYRDPVDLLKESNLLEEFEAKHK